MDRTSLNAVALKDTVAVERQQFHALRQDKLAGGGGAGAVLPVTGQDVRHLGHDLFPHMFGVVVQHITDCCNKNMRGLV